MLERALILLAVAALLTLGVLVVRTWTRAREGRLATAPGESLWTTLGARPDGRATVIAFSTPSCAACHTAQLPALQALQAQVGEAALRVLRVDVAAQPETARAFGVLTVPSTVVLEPTGRVAAVNHGFTPSGRLAAQLAPLL